MNTFVRLTLDEARATLGFLDSLSTHIESAIESEIVPGTDEAMKGRKRLLTSLRKDWRKLEDLKIVLDRNLRGRDE